MGTSVPDTGQGGLPTGPGRAACPHPQTTPALPTCHLTTGPSAVGRVPRVAPSLPVNHTHMSNTLTRAACTQTRPLTECTSTREQALRHTCPTRRYTDLGRAGASAPHSPAHHLPACLQFQITLCPQKTGRSWPHPSMGPGDQARWSTQLPLYRALSLRQRFLWARQEGRL